MSSPTAKEISEAFPDLGDVKAKQLAEVLAAPGKVSDNDDEFVKAVDEALEKANGILDGHGIEAATGEGSNLGPYWRNTILVYVNMGDTYDTTVLFDPDEEEFSIGSWGDFIEAWENEEDDDEEEDKEEGEEEEGEDDGDEDAEEENAETEEVE